MTSIPFVSTLRARGETIVLGEPGDDALSIRVQVPETWDVVRLRVAPSESVVVVKQAALAALAPKADHRAYVMKLRGFEVLNESDSLRDAGAIDGSIFLLTHRRRRPVR